MGYLWRFGLLLSSWPFGSDWSIGFGRNARWDAACLCLMVLPNVTSFVFAKHVPLENKGDNVTIWKEYRLHNLIFVLQSTVFLSLNVYEMHHNHRDGILALL